jgi:hypothetical protein
MADLILKPLENDVLKLLLAGEDFVLDLLRQQLRSSNIYMQQFTGFGYYLYFKVLKNEKALEGMVKPSFCFGDVDVMLLVGDRWQRVGFLLWVKNGVLDFLEAYTYGDEKWPERFDEYRLNYLGGQRNFADLRRNWEL